MAGRKVEGPLKSRLCLLMFCPLFNHPSTRKGKPLMRSAFVFVLATVAGGFVGPATRHVPCQAGRFPPTRPAMPQMKVVSQGKSPLPISATATAVGAGLVARVAGVSSFKWLATTVAGSACAATYGLGILTWWQERPGTIENNAAKALLSSRHADRWIDR